MDGFVIKEFEQTNKRTNERKKQQQILEMVG